MIDNSKRSVNLNQAITLEHSITEFREIATEIAPTISNLLREYGPMTATMLRYMLTRKHGLNITIDAVATILQGFYPDDVTLLDAYAPNNIYGIIGDEGRTTALPAVSDYATAYYDLLIRWEAVRANPGLLDLTDEYIDALHQLKPERLK